MSQGFRLTGRHVFFVLAAFFAVTIGVNAVFITAAVRTFRGEEVPKAYLQGLDYNTVLERRAAQKALGWTSRLTLEGDRLLLDMAAPDGALPGLVLEAGLKHPADKSLDHALAFENLGEGRYAASLAGVPEGHWTFWVRTNEGPPFEAEQRLWTR